MRWQSGKKHQIRKQTLWQQQCGAWQAIGRQWPGLRGGAVVLLSKRGGSHWVSGCGDESSGNRMKCTLYWHLIHNKQKKAKKKRNWKKKKGIRTASHAPAPPTLRDVQQGGAGQGSGSDLSSDPIAKAFAQISQWLLEKNSSVGGDSLLCLLCCATFHFVSFQFCFSLSADCVSPSHSTLSLSICLPSLLLPALFPALRLCRCLDA